MPIRRITQPEPALVSQLAALLMDAVRHGASLGFLKPLAEVTAARYWEGVMGSLGGTLAMWVAEEDGKVVGTVQLAPSAKDNAWHRAEVMKLFVLTPYRGKGIAEGLMGAVEAYARSIGRTLLVLDTQVGSGAETLYQKLGWQKVGEIPGYAASPDGTMRATAYYYKSLRI